MQTAAQTHRQHVDARHRVSARTTYQTRAVELHDGEHVDRSFASLVVAGRARRLVQIEAGETYSVLTGENGIGSIYVEVEAEGKRWAAVLLPGSF